MVNEKFYQDFEKYFRPAEFFPREMVAELSRHFIWGWMDRRLLEAIYQLRVFTKIPIMINYGGLQYSGFRPSDCGIGAQYSAHRIGKAADLHASNDTDLSILTQFVMEYGYLMGFTEVENPGHTPGWLHVSTRETGITHLKVINP